MPIVDITNQATVVEVVADNTVAEFTESLATIEVANGTPLVEFMAGADLIAGPGLAGGGYLLGDVPIDLDVNGLVAETEVDPDADYFLMWDNSAGEHRKVRGSHLPDNSAPGSSGAYYEGENLGVGSAIYKETDDTVDPRIHRFRSLLAGSNISLAQTDDDITISALALSENGAIAAFAAGSLSGGCGAASSFYSSSLGGLEVGDLIIWTVVSPLNSATYASMLPPSDWQTLWRAIHLANQYRWTSYFYKFAEATDLDPATQHVMTTAGSNILCSTVFYFKNIHQGVPFGGAIGSKAIQQMWAPPIPASCPSSPIVTTWQSRDGSNGFAATDPFGAVMDHTEDHTQYLSGTTYANWRCESTLAGVDEDENWIEGETLAASGQGSNWTALACSVSRYGTYFSELDGTVGPGRHYIERTVSLVAGQDYMFAFSMGAIQWGIGDEGQMTISYVDPLNDERLLHIYGAGFERNSGSCLRLDPQADFGTTWFNRTVTISEDGVPSQTGSVPTIHFTAQITGTYKLRIGISTSANGESYVSGGGENRRFSGILFRRGWYTYHRTNTASGALYNGSIRSAIHGPCYATPTGGGVGRVFSGFSLNPAWTQLPRAKVVPFHGAHGDITFCVADDGLTVLPFFPTTDDSSPAGIVNRPIMPMINSVRQRYYMEWTIVTAGTNIILGFLYPLNQDAPYYDGGSYTGYYWHVEDLVWRNPTGSSDGGADAGTASLATGNVVGAEVDFEAREIKWYKNGILVKTQSMIDNHPAGGGGLAGLTSDMPLWAMARVHKSSGGGSAGVVTFNIIGPFLHPISGTIAYDWAGATELEYVDAVESAGAGVSLVSGTPTAPTIKSLIAGDNISIDDLGEEVRITATYSAAPPTFDPMTTAEFFDDFMMASLSNNDFISATSNGTDAGITLVTAPDAGTVGVYSQNTGTASTGRNTLASQRMDQLSIGDGEMRYRTRVRVTTALSDGTNGYIVVCGFTNAVSGITREISFRYSDDINAGNWSVITTDSMGTNTLDTGVPVVLNQWYTLELVVNAVGDSVSAYIDGVIVGTTISNIPASGDHLGVMNGIYKNSGTTSRSMQADYMFLRKVLTAAR